MQPRLRQLSKEMKQTWTKLQSRLRLHYHRGRISANERELMRQRALLDLLRVQTGEMDWDEWKAKHNTFRPTGRPKKTE